MKKNILIVSVFLGFLSVIIFFATRNPITNEVPTVASREVIVGVLYSGSAFKPAFDGFRDGLAKNITAKNGIEITYDVIDVTGTTKEEFLASARELVSRKPALIVAISPDLIVAAKVATEGTSIPVLYAFGGDPVDEGFVKSMENSENNLTGITWNSWKLSGKRIEILKRIVPSIKTVLVVGRKTTSSQVSLRSVEASNKELGLNIVLKLVDTKEELISVLSAIDPKKIDAISYATDPLFVRHNNLFIKFALEKKLPFISQQESFAQMGALASYGSEFYPAGVELSAHARKILVERKLPSTIPSETTKQVYFVLNNDTATMIGVEFPEDVLSVANKVIIRSTPSAQ